MKDHPVSVKTRKRKRCRTNSHNAVARTLKERLSWSSLFWTFAAAAIVASPSSSSSTSTSTSHWAVRGQPENGSTSTATATSHTNTNTASENSNTNKETANVRGGRSGESRGGRAFVRQNQQQQQQKESIDTTNGNSNSNSNSNLSDNPHGGFLSWCQDSLGIDTGLVEIDLFDYPDYLRAMEDRLDIFCDDCDDEDDYSSSNDFEGDNNNNNNAQSEQAFDDFNAPSLDETDRYLSVNDEYPPVSVRGLKASRDIQVGEVVLSIPHSALWTVHNAIDASGDANLVDSMGPTARQTHEWESPGMDEIPLLAITLLYHMDAQQQNNNNNNAQTQNKNNSVHAPYLEILTSSKLQDSIPHLWDSRKLRKSATPEVRRVAKGIRQDVVDLYESIVMVLIQEHPTVFGKHKDGHNNEKHDPSKDDTTTDVVAAATAAEANNTNTKEWMFSLEKFHWAFALVNSRHWHLQIPDDPFAVEEMEVAVEVEVEEKDTTETTTLTDNTNTNTDTTFNEQTAEPQMAPGPDLEPQASELDSNFNPDSNVDPNNDDAPAPPPEDDHESLTDQEGPPAATPTDEWVVIQDAKLREEEEREIQQLKNSENTNNTSEDASSTPTSDQYDDSNNNSDYNWPLGNSFLAPLADLLNFGPPCTRGIYNSETMAFEIVATCEFKTGQEITFWYADACEDVFVANYGFTVPMMVPKCDHNEQQRQNLQQNNPSSLDAEHFQWQQQQQEHQQQYLEDELFHAYEEMDRLDRRLDFLMNVLEDCHCGNQTELLAGAWKYDEGNDHDENRYGNDTQDNAISAPGGSGSGRTPLPRSPSPPSSRISSSTIIHNNNNQKHSKKGPEAQHAIRDGRSRKSKKNGTNEMQHQHQQRQHKNHHGMTRFRSRSHQGRRFEF